MVPNSAPAVPCVAGITRWGTAGPRRYGSWFAVAVPAHRFIRRYRAGAGSWFKVNSPVSPVVHRWYYPAVPGGTLAVLCAAGITRRSTIRPRRHGRWRYGTAVGLPAPGVGSNPTPRCRQHGAAGGTRYRGAVPVPRYAPRSSTGRGVWLRGVRGVSRRNPTIYL